MYCVLEGVIKLLFNLWFFILFKIEFFNILDKVLEVDEKLLKIKLLNDIIRCL